MSKYTYAYFDIETISQNETTIEWLRLPFPSDYRRNDNGNVILNDYPNPDHIRLLSEFQNHAENNLTGFGTSSPIYFHFSTPIKTDLISKDPSSFMHVTSPIQLIDLSPTSPEYGQRRPLFWEYWKNDGLYINANTLAVTPYLGFPLREATTYGLIITNELYNSEGTQIQAPPLLKYALDAPLSNGTCASPIKENANTKRLRVIYEPLRSALPNIALRPEAIAAATVFTTQSIVTPLAAIHNHINLNPNPLLINHDEWQAMSQTPLRYYQGHSFQWNQNERVNFFLMEGRYPAPNFQHGEIPYATLRNGGRFIFKDSLPEVADMESIRFVLSFPEAPAQTPDGCYPIVIYAHGTGGDAYSFTESTAGRLAARGLASISIDQPLHGIRSQGKSFDLNLMTFNFTNPESARTTLRQGTADIFSLVRFAREALEVPADKSPNDEVICFDTTRMSFFGHSQGSLSGAMAAAIEDKIGAWVLSGAGGGLSMTLLQRKDFINLKDLIAFLVHLSGPATESLSLLHPVTGLIQMLTDITDPLNYAAYWTWQSVWSQPVNMLMTSGLNDAATPFKTAIALAVAGYVPQVEPIAQEIPEYTWLELEPAKAPLVGNLNNKTIGFIQWDQDNSSPHYADHYVIFYRPEAIHASMRFLESYASNSLPSIERDPNSDVR